ncbi:M10 family metallopeptidase C-terminal domain-containing protein [Antarctobacter sp.]|uniref:M10 family metallopeptidase C-terminal domain-containing protein n=1 Tax=Antarctobacter sp. TaxID=1872577 RepID=UPI002B26FBF9|nr:M10 family metallopeptidase C-terminal domain-containing protein [Antarctobacter sp.]
MNRPLPHVLSLPEPNPKTDDYDFHGLTGSIAAAATSGDGDRRAFNVHAGDTLTVNLDGLDLIDLGTRVYNQRLSLTDATWSDLDGYVGNFGIACGAVIENAITVAGDDTFDGGSGDDTVIVTGASEGNDLNWDGTLRITDTDLTDGDDRTDMLTGVETLSFADGALGTIQNHGAVTRVRLYKTGSGLTEGPLEVDATDSHGWQSIARSFTASGQWTSPTNAYDRGQRLSRDNL